MDAPETDVLPADGFIQIAGEKVKYAAMPEIRLRLRVFFSITFCANATLRLPGFVWMKCKNCRHVKYPECVATR